MTDPTSQSQPAVDPALVARVKGILLQPKIEWLRIDGEFATNKSLFTRYAMILAAIGPVATLVGSLVFGHASIVSALVLTIVSYGLSLASVFILGLIINALASSFGGAPNPVQAMKLAVYASTASWIAGVFNLIPLLGWLSIIGGIYSLVLLFLGLPILMKAPEDKKVVYFIVVLIAGLILGFIMAAIVGAIALTFVASTAGLAAMGAGY
ncbi:Yip1 family protein [Brevundimonas intermedia]|uniref:Yip1 family protein n=1 Tax=Brevundimonas intermedia TaxID=74315 RepID=UPI00320A7D3F